MEALGHPPCNANRAETLMEYQRTLSSGWSKSKRFPGKHYVLGVEDDEVVAHDDLPIEVRTGAG